MRSDDSASLLRVADDGDCLLSKRIFERGAKNYFVFIIDALLDPPAAFCNIEDLRAVAACDQRGACTCCPWAILVKAFAKMLEVGGKNYLGT